VHCLSADNMDIMVNDNNAELDAILQIK